MTILFRIILGIVWAAIFAFSMFGYVFVAEKISDKLSGDNIELYMILIAFFVLAPIFIIASLFSPSA